MYVRRVVPSGCAARTTQLPVRSAEPASRKQSIETLIMPPPTMCPASAALAHREKGSGKSLGADAHHRFSPLSRDGNLSTPVVELDGSRAAIGAEVVHQR